MKRSVEICTPLVAALAAAASMSGCSNPSVVRRCADAQGNLRPENECSQVRGGLNAARWVYGGNVMGNRIQNHSMVAPSGADVVSSGGRTISRGGFGGGRGFFGG